jgi:hypothetical protein
MDSAPGGRSRRVVGWWWSLIWTRHKVSLEASRIHYPSLSGKGVEGDKQIGTPSVVFMGQFDPVGIHEEQDVSCQEVYIRVILAYDWHSLPVSTFQMAAESMNALQSEFGERPILDMEAMVH